MDVFILQFRKNGQAWGGVLDCAVSLVESSQMLPTDVLAPDLHVIHDIYIHDQCIYNAIYHYNYII